MRKKIAISDIIETSGGNCISGDRDAFFTGVSIDSRKIKRGEIFFAIKGVRFDGHDYVNDAIERGASGVVISRNVCGIDSSISVVLVNDTLVSLQNLAKNFRNRFTGSVVAITGTAGKTTTKEITAIVLSKYFNVHKNEGNINNEYGVPLTILGMPDNCDVLLIEVGINHIGEMKVISDIVRPTVAIATNIGPGHIGFFGSLEKIAREKEELFIRLPSDGWAVLNADDTYTSNFSTFAQKLTFGIDSRADIRPNSWEDKGIDGTRFRIGRTEFHLPIPGKHNLYNALSSIACGKVFGIELKDMVSAISKARSVPSRMEIYTVGNVVLVNDAYNANPLSMHSSIGWFISQSYKRHILVLGDMLELGDFAFQEHKNLGEFIAKLHMNDNIDLLFTTGELGKIISETAQNFSRSDKWVKHTLKDELSKSLIGSFTSGDGVLFKASRLIALDDVFRDVFERLKMEVS
ncbi:MAG: UDP-N-acetylmuramoyl-tripeptide--D-alanyl-D-alanine ligase [bacterium]